jgi:hypothetical protein
VVRTTRAANLTKEAARRLNLIVWSRACRSRTTNIDFGGTALMPKLKGALEWNSRESRTVHGMYGLHPRFRPDERTPVDICEARSAARIACQAGAEHYAADAYAEHCNFYKGGNMMVISPSPFGVIELCLLGRKEVVEKNAAGYLNTWRLDSDERSAGPYRPLPALTAPNRFANTANCQKCQNCYC